MQAAALLSLTQGAVPGVAANAASGEAAPAGEQSPFAQALADASAAGAAVPPPATAAAQAPTPDQGASAAPPGVGVRQTLAGGVAATLSAPMVRPGSIASSVRAAIADQLSSPEGEGAEPSATLAARLTPSAPAAPDATLGSTGAEARGDDGLQSVLSRDGADAPVVDATAGLGLLLPPQALTGADITRSLEGSAEPSAEGGPAASSSQLDALAAHQGGTGLGATEIADPATHAPAGEQASAGTEPSEAKLGRGHWENRSGAVDASPPVGEAVAAALAPSRLGTPPIQPAPDAPSALAHGGEPAGLADEARSALAVVFNPSRPAAPLTPDNRRSGGGGASRAEPAAVGPDGMPLQGAARSDSPSETARSSTPRPLVSQGAPAPATTPAPDATQAAQGAASRPAKPSGQAQASPAPPVAEPAIIRSVAVEVSDLPETPPHAAAPDAAFAPGSQATLLASVAERAPAGVTAVAAELSAVAAVAVRLGEGRKTLTSAPEPTPAPALFAGSATASAFGASVHAAAGAGEPGSQQRPLELAPATEGAPQAIDPETVLEPPSTEIADAPPASIPAPTAPARGSAETVANLAAQIARRLEGRNTRFEIALDPHGLGAVQVSVEINAQGELSAHMAFERGETAAELRGRAAELQRALEQAGFDLSRGGLSFADAGGRERQADQNAGRRAHARAFQDAVLAADAADAPPVPPTRLRDHRRAGLDVRI